jgi:delta 1-pyrroline-5-carboxylate dehydrogenase
MKDFMTEIKMINVAETIAKDREGKDFTRYYYNKLRKDYNLPTIEFARKHGIIKVTSSDTFEIVRNGETITAKRYFYGLDKDKYKEIMSFMGTRSGLRKYLRRCSFELQANTAKMKMLGDRNAEIETFLELVGQW